MLTPKKTKILEAAEEVVEKRILPGVESFESPRWSDKVLFEVLNRANATPDEVRGAAIEGMRKSTVYTKEDYKKLNTLLKDSTELDRDDFYSLWLSGQENKHWFTDEEMDSINVSSKTKELYNDYHKSSDIKYVTDNVLERKRMEAEGWKVDPSSGLFVKKADNRILDNDEYFSRVSILDEDGNILNYKNRTANWIKGYLDDNGYELMQVHPRNVDSSDLGYTHYMTKANQALDDLPQYVLPYVEGGSRMYTNGTHFVKIGRTFYSADDVKFNGYPKTLIAGNDTKKLQQYADEVNQVIEAFNKYKTDMTALQEELLRIDPQEFKVKSAVDLYDLMRSPENPTGLIDPNYTAKVLRGDEKYSVSNGLKNLDRLDEYDLSLSQLMDLRGKYYKSKGDEILDNINGTYDHVVDPFKMWQRNIEQAAQAQTLGETLLNMGEFFKKRYTDVIDKSNGYNPNRMSGSQVIATANIKAPNSDLDDVARAARRMQTFYKNILNIPTKSDEIINKGIQNAVHLLPKSWWDTKAMDKLLATHPAQAMNSIVFRTYMGCFNIAQFFKQGIGSMLNTTALADPVRAAQALFTMPWAIMGHFFKDTPILKEAAKILPKVAGVSGEMFEGFLKYMDDFGTYNQLSNRPEIHRYNNFLKTKAGWKNADLVFLELGNNTGQLYADLVSYLTLGGKDLRAVARYSDDLMLNISRANTSTFQRSTVGTLVGQFTSYPLSVLEAMTGKRFDGAAKARFILANLGLWGFSGTFSRDNNNNIYNWFEDNTNMTPEMIRYVVDGYVTNYFAAKGITVQEGPDLFGVFSQVAGMIPGLHELFGEAPDLPVSNIGSIIGDCYQLAKDLYDPTVTTWDLLSFARIVSQKAGLPTGLKNASKAIIAFDAKQYWDKHGDVLSKDMNLTKSFATLIGFGPVEVRLKQMRYDEQKAIQEAILDIYNNTVKVDIDRINTYKRTGYGHTELEHNRTESWAALYGAYRNDLRAFKAYVRTMHPEWSKYAMRLIVNGMRAGQNVNIPNNSAEEVIFRHINTRLGVE